MKTNVAIIIIGLIILDIVAWGTMLFGSQGKQSELFFFDVGQGDSEMVVMPGDVKLLIDGGPNNGKAAGQLERALPWHDRYIDMVMLSHAELDHFGGLLDVLQRYEVGAFIYNGNGSDSESFKELAKVVRERNIPVIIMGKGDRIVYASSTIDMVSGGGAFKKDNKNESALVARFVGGGMSALFAGDIGKDTEAQLVRGGDMHADILKIAHHGSKYSSTEEFLKAVRPTIAIIEVGKNSYGHPTKDALERIKRTGARLFRTDTNGMIRLTVENGTIKQRKEK